MKPFTLLIFLSLITISCNEFMKDKDTITGSISADITTYYLIRHAEKDRSDPNDRNPHLTDEGKNRAQRWAEVFKNIAFNEIYSTDFNRTQETLQPTVNNGTVKITIYNPDNLYSEDFKTRTEGKTVLVAGHSDTTPQFVNAIMGKKLYENMDDTDNGSLYIVTICGNSKKVQVLHID